MINLTICNNTLKKTINVAGTKTINEILADEGMTTAGCTFHLDGIPLDDNERETAIQELTDSDEAILVVVVAQKAGC